MFFPFTDYQKFTLATTPGNSNQVSYTIPFLALVVIRPVILKAQSGNNAKSSSITVTDPNIELAGTQRDIYTNPSDNGIDAFNQSNSPIVAVYGAGAVVTLRPVTTAQSIVEIYMFKLPTT